MCSKLCLERGGVAGCFLSRIFSLCCFPSSLVTRNFPCMVVKHLLPSKSTCSWFASPKHVEGVFLCGLLGFFVKKLIEVFLA